MVLSVWIHVVLLTLLLESCKIASCCNAVKLEVVSENDYFKGKAVMKFGLQLY